MILINECNKVNKKNDFIVILLLDYNIISHHNKKKLTSFNMFAINISDYCISC